MPAQTVIKLRRGTASQWTTANPVLDAGEMGIETDTNRSKFGDGATAWTSLSYAVGDSSGIGTVDWDAVLNKPTEFNPEAHAATHGSAGSDPITIAAESITSGTLNSARLPVVPVSKGGTGGTTAATGREGLEIYVQEAEPTTPATNAIWIF